MQSAGRAGPHTGGCHSGTHLCLVLNRETYLMPSTHLTDRWRISVRDLLMLLAVLISSFSNESVYPASWSRLAAQSALRASSSARTVCGWERGGGSAGRPLVVTVRSEHPDRKPFQRHPCEFPRPPHSVSFDALNPVCWC